MIANRETEEKQEDSREEEKGSKIHKNEEGIGYIWCLLNELGRERLLLQKGIKGITRNKNGHHFH